MKNKYYKLFYRSVARIRAIGANPGIVTTDRIKRYFRIGWIRASDLRDELTVAGVLRTWNKNDYNNKPKRRGNILWENMRKFRVPREVTLKEQKRVKFEIKKGLLPLKAGDL